MNKEINLLLIGEKSFIANTISKSLKKKIKLKKISFEKFKKLKIEYLGKFSHICNCAINKNYQIKKYQKKNDIDLAIVKKISKLNLRFIFLSSRKVYKCGPNIKENSRLNASSNYSKNKIITEKKIRKIISKNHIILRISNLIGKPYQTKNQRKISNTFIDNYFKYLSYNKKIYYENFYKDFLSVKQFTHIFLNILKNQNINGTYNLSLGKKVYIKEIISALSKYKNNNFTEIKKKSSDDFFLNNKKLIKMLKVKINKKDLLKYCKNI